MAQGLILKLTIRKKEKIRINLSREIWMRNFLINKNLCLYYWLKKRIRKKWALRVASAIEKMILIFGRKALPCFNRSAMPTEDHE